MNPRVPPSKHTLGKTLRKSRAEHLQGSGSPTLPSPPRREDGSYSLSAAASG